MKKAYFTPKMKRKAGFTLAEVLLAMTIIGIIASYTIPDLIQNTQNDVAATRVKKAFSTFSQAQISLTEEGISMDTIFAGDWQAAAVFNRISPKLNIVKNCGTGTGCFPNVVYKKLNSVLSANTNTNTAYAKAILADGSMIVVMDLNGGCDNDNSNGAGAASPLYKTCGYIFIDIDGFKGKSQMGRDVFFFWVTRTGVFPFGSNNDVYQADCIITGNGFGCAAKVLLEGAINY